MDIKPYVFDPDKLKHGQHFAYPLLEQWEYDGHVLDIPGEADRDTAIASAQAYCLNRLAEKLSKPR